MKHLSNESLIAAYHKARQLNLQEKFINLLETEINNRSVKNSCRKEHNVATK